MINRVGLQCARASARFTAVSPAAFYAPRHVAATFHSARVNLFEKSSASNSAATEIEHKSRISGSYHWNFERALSIVSVPLLGAAAVVGPNALIDFALGVVIPLHIHLGLDSVIVDYLPARRTKVLNILATWGLRIGTGLALYGCYQFNTNDVGLTAFVKRLWTGKL
ncbi:CybS-domain-containing protein [Polychytrium aggregatum]|uniref:CybS-domain-containing protein n=1 Tax=Polychytrium aggregatum TaxID=110093 RepID=UPI0022FE61E9|nr:CybS-domain-containing protein [Polychytrium aggregatum]KAI9202327.1 CybS-domain-containing protein [Polychytrium aggregatum]